MMRYLMIISGLLLSLPAWSLLPDSLEHAMYFDIDQVIITATRTPKSIIRIPGQSDVINSRTMEKIPLLNVDDALKTMANVYVNRSWGIFSKNSSVTMRGLPGSERTLVLIDGIPKNKTAGGSVNWHNIHPDVIERIEVVRGPASALYGNNAMGGVINIVTKKPKENLEGSVEAFYGSHMTLGGNAVLSGHSMKETDHGWYWMLNGNYRQGDGYIFEPLEYLDDNDVETYLREYGTGFKLGYQFRPGNTLEIAAGYYDELRGGGKKVFEEKGSFDAFLTKDIRIKYDASYGSTRLLAKAYYANEDYENQKESLNDKEEYSLTNSYTDKSDIGSIISLSRPFSKRHLITMGTEIRSGNVKGEEFYRTSTDEIFYQGSLDFYSIFFQDEISLGGDKLSIIAGMRTDFARFRNGSQEVLNPTKETGFPEGFYKSFGKTGWQAFSPKLSLQYNITGDKTAYVLAGTGFKPPKIDDLCKSGKIRKGFRLANPDLKPEKLINLEAGFKGNAAKNLYLSTAMYYSIGRDFQYLVSTGDSVNAGGGKPKPVYTRDNVSRVGITGFEISMNWAISKQVSLQSGYSYNHSVILEYPQDDPDLTGKYLVEVPPHLFYGGISWENRYMATVLNCNYTDAQWADDENLIYLEEHFLVNFRIETGIIPHLKLYLSCQNLFDVEFIDRKNQLSPGRYLLAGIKYII